MQTPFTSQVVASDDGRLQALAENERMRELISQLSRENAAEVQKVKSAEQDQNVLLAKGSWLTFAIKLSLTVKEAQTTLDNLQKEGAILKEELNRLHDEKHENERRMEEAKEESKKHTTDIETLVFPTLQLLSDTDRKTQLYKLKMKLPFCRQQSTIKKLNLGEYEKKENNKYKQL